MSAGQRLLSLALLPLRVVTGTLSAVFRTLATPSLGREFRKGQTLRVRRPLDVQVLVHVRGPMTDGIACSLAPGLELLVSCDASASARGVQCVPKRLGEFVIEHVPAETRRDPRFSGVSILLDHDDLAFIDVVD